MSYCFSGEASSAGPPPCESALPDFGLSVTELRAHWDLVRRISGRSRIAGNLLGAAEFPAEVLLTKLFRESPTSEIAIAVRR